jgi:hypothetical protein
VVVRAALSRRVVRLSRADATAIAAELEAEAQEYGRTLEAAFRTVLVLPGADFRLPSARQLRRAHFRALADHGKK